MLRAYPPAMITQSHVISCARHAIVAALFVVLPAVAAERPLRTVDALDLARYMGTWHQIALLPNWFQRRCASDTTATYSANADGSVRVLNRCRDADGKPIEAEGVARRNAKYARPGILQVRFAPRVLSALPFVWGDYWVIELTEDYGAVLIGAPNREYLWILARTPTLDAATYSRLVDVARAEGFDVGAIVRQ